jgi:PIN domain nuclease of toxin-antitoxin system
MKLLLDTHVLLWAVAAPERLSPSAQSLLGDVDHELLFSAVSIWEVAIKAGMGRTDFRANARLLRRGLLDHGYVEVPVISQHAVEIDNLPPIHRDPFDRLLIAQAMIEGVELITSDTIVARYPGPIRLV